MKLYSKKQQWKKILALVGLGIVVFIVFLTSRAVNNVKKAELEKIQLWSEAIKKKAKLVRLTNEAFDQLAQNERNKVWLWAKATNEVLNKKEFEFALEITHQNNSIPLILTEQNGKYINHKNIDLLNQIPILQRQHLIDSLCPIWSAQNNPIEINYFEDKIQKIYYSNSEKYFELYVLRDSLLNSFSSDIMNNIAQLPVIFWSAEGDTLIASNVINSSTEKEEVDIKKMEMEKDNDPVEIFLGENHSGKIYYHDSAILFQLKYFPLIILLVIAFFLLISYWLFSSFRRAEQNQVWAGMAKETAHQLGTPLSSLQGWIEILRDKDLGDEEAFLEMEKDIKRLTMVSERFSKIGSKVDMDPTDLVVFFNAYLEYMQKRIPKSVKLTTDIGEESVIAKINTPLFSWVIENIMKNAADAMGGEGELKISLSKSSTELQVLIEDNGRGISSSIQKTIFEPGFTTKERGWGLGLSLAKRIVEGHHGGRISVKYSKKDVGTGIEIILPLDLNE